MNGKKWLVLLLFGSGLLGLLFMDPIAPSLTVGAWIGRR